MVKRWKIVSVSMRARPRPRDRKDEKGKRKKRESRTKVILRIQGGERVKGCESNSKKEYETKKSSKRKIHMIEMKTVLWILILKRVIYFCQ